MLIFALVMETRRKGYIEQLITQGEHVHQDFKYQITDARKIARSISAFANNSGGHLLVGVKDNGSIVGVSSDEEIYMIEQAAQMYCQPEQQVKFEVFRVAGHRPTPHSIQNKNSLFYFGLLNLRSSSIFQYASLAAGLKVQALKGRPCRAAVRPFLCRA